MKLIPAIHHAEFLRSFQACKPTSGWPKKIAVANSGGPDSTCLLYLMSKLDIPVVSLAVDHDLQATSSNMAEIASRNASLFGVDYLTLKIPWFKPPFKRPTSSQVLERTARDARYRVLFDGMTRTGASVIAFGHHADDQVETSLMRLGKGSTLLGAAGMRACRRWGMGEGSEGDVSWTGHLGLRRWIIRPLLPFSKDRIYATCEEHGLAYVTDPTNFQPDLTIRNSIRSVLSKSTGKIASQGEEITNSSLDKLDIANGSVALRDTVSKLSSQIDDVHDQARIILHEMILPSPLGTLLICPESSSNIHTIPNLVRSSIIIHILRYISPHPWGSLRADADRRTSSIQRAIDIVWNNNNNHCKAFTIGAGVLWTPVIIKSNSSFQQLSDLTEGQSYGYLVSRARPYAANAASLNTDITSQLAHNINSTFEIPYDNRFLIRIKPSSVAIEKGTTITIQPDKKWFSPIIIQSQQNKDDTTIASLYPKVVHTPGITIEWIRPLEV